MHCSLPQAPGLVSAVARRLPARLSRCVALVTESMGGTILVSDTLALLKEIFWGVNKFLESE